MDRDRAASLPLASTSDGFGPYAGLAFDSKGALYGTTYFGGTLGFGTVFKLTPPAPGKTAWTETILYSFKGGTDGVQSRRRSERRQ